MGKKKKGDEESPGFLGYAGASLILLCLGAVLLLAKIFGSKKKEKQLPS